MKRLLAILPLLLCVGCARTVRLDGKFTILRARDALMLVIIEDEAQRAAWLLAKSIRFRDGMLRKQTWRDNWWRAEDAATDAN